MMTDGCCCIKDVAALSMVSNQLLKGVRANDSCQLHIKSMQ